MLTKTLMRCVHLDDTKTLWENRKLTMMEYEGHYVDVHSMSCLMVEPFFCSIRHNIYIQPPNLTCIRFLKRLI
jgi:hypothetical protein